VCQEVSREENTVEEDRGDTWTEGHCHTKPRRVMEKKRNEKKK
jgi:hypothetical protein